MASRSPLEMLREMAAQRLLMQQQMNAGALQQMGALMNAQQLANFGGRGGPGNPLSPVTPVPRSDLRVCDLVGWRVWRITANGYLQSTTVDKIWLPGEPMTGILTDHQGGGVHAWKRRDAALVYSSFSATRHCCGSVLLWGDIVEHEHGYRAGNARVLSIDDITWDNEPPWSAKLKTGLRFLRERYGLT